MNEYDTVMFYSRLSKKFFRDGIVQAHRLLPGGHIHRTHVVNISCNHIDKEYIFQRINTDIFGDPEAIMYNIQTLSQHLKEKQTGPNPYSMKILAPCSSINSEPGIWFEGSFWRVFPFFKDALCLDHVTDPKIAHSAGRAFGHFLYHLSELDASSINDILPGFHSGTMRANDFKHAVKTDVTKRKGHIKAMINKVRTHLNQLYEFDERKETLPNRVIHHDAKLNNVLLDKNTYHPIAVIDLDTVMSGSVMSDFGDLVRSLTSSQTEDKASPSELFVNLPVFRALTRGFMEEAREVLNHNEVKSLVFGAQAITLMVAVRFLTDYLEGDHYFKISYPNHNLDRAANQLALFEALLKCEPEMKQIVEAYS